MYCKKCGINNPDEALFCKNCGRPVVEKNEILRCQHCKQENDRESKYCKKCGEEMNAKTKPIEVTKIIWILIAVVFVTLYFTQVVCGTLGIVILLLAVVFVLASLGMIRWRR